MPKYQNTHIYSRVEKTENYFARRCDNKKDYVGTPSEVRSCHNGMSSKEVYLAEKRRQEEYNRELKNAFRL